MTVKDLRDRSGMKERFSPFQNVVSECGRTWLAPASGRWRHTSPLSFSVTATGPQQVLHPDSPQVLAPLLLLLAKRCRKVRRRECHSMGARSVKNGSPKRNARQSLAGISQ